MLLVYQALLAQKWNICCGLELSHNSWCCLWESLTIFLSSDMLFFYTGFLNTKSRMCKVAIMEESQITYPQEEQQ